MTLLVRDEQDIIRENIEYHLSQGVDFFIATDNKSIDDTTNILKQYERRGVLHYIYEGNDNYNQYAWVTRMARMAFTEFGADWIINNDADEFWWPLKDDLKETFRHISSKYNIITANRTNFVAVDDSDTPFYHRMVYRETNSLNPVGKPLPPKTAHRGNAEIRVAQGNHSVTGFEDPKSITDVVEILHFPIRTYAQLENKIIKGGAAYERNEELPAPIGNTWRKLYSDYQSNSNLNSYYEKNYYNSKKISEALAAGSILPDNRLSIYFSEKNLDGICRTQRTGL